MRLRERASERERLALPKINQTHGKIFLYRIFVTAEDSQSVVVIVFVVKVVVVIFVFAVIIVIVTVVS